MHVCHFCDTTFESDFFKNIALGLSQRGVSVSLVELGEGSRPKWLPETPGVSYINLHCAHKLHYPLAVRRLARFLEREKVDILHTHLYFSGLIGVLSKRLRPKTQVAIMRHHTSVVRLLGSRLHVAADKWMAEKADHVTTVSRSAVEYMRDVDRIGRDKIDIVYTGFDFEKLAPNVADRLRVRHEFGFDRDDLVIGYAANFVNGKGHIQLVNAFQKIAAELPHARLFLPGRGMLPNVQEAAQNLPEGKLVFAGWRDDISACLNAMDLFVQPSLSEAFSQVLVEAMGVGLPVIATRVGGADEVIVNGENGVLIASNDPDAIYRGALRMYNDAAKRDAIARNGMLSVRERFTVPMMIDRLMDLYESWLGKEVNV